MDAFKTINDVLVNLFYEILELEEKAIITDEFRDISNNDMHIICRLLWARWPFLLY